MKESQGGNNMETTITPAICGFCGGYCLVDLHLQDGKIVKVEGNKTLPFSDGRLCVKGAALKQATYSPDRLLYPMKRVGNRGEGRFERISWEKLWILSWRRWKIQKKNMERNLPWYM